MRKLITCFSIIAAIAYGAKAQSVTAPTVNAPGYVNIDSSINTIGTMNKALQNIMTGYKQATTDENPMETGFVFTSSTAQPLRVLYATKNSRGTKVISRISIIGDMNDLEGIYKNLFNSNRKIDVNKNTYQLDYFDYNGKKHYVRFDPDTENNQGTNNWSIIIGKY